MGRFGKWLEEKDPKALNELAGSPMGEGDDEDPVDPKSGVKLSTKMENYLSKLIKAMDTQRLSKKKQIEVLNRVIAALQGTGMTNTTGTSTMRAATH